MSSLRGSNLVFHLITSIESDLIPCVDHPDSHFSKPPPVGPAALIAAALSGSEPFVSSHMHILGYIVATRLHML